MANVMSVPALVLDMKLDGTVLPRVHARVVRECNRRMMMEHGKYNLEKHFQPGAETAYGYSDRRSDINVAFIYRANRDIYDRLPKLIGKNGKTINRSPYAAVKAALGFKPLEWSGDLHRAVTYATRQHSSYTATQYLATLKIKTPPWATSRVQKLRFLGIGSSTGDELWVNEKGRVIGNKHRVIQMQREALARSAEIQAINSGDISHLKAFYKATYLEIMRDPTNPRNAGFIDMTKAVLRTRSRRKS